MFSIQSKRTYKALHPTGNPFDYQPNRNPQLNLISLLLWATEGDKTQLSLANGNPAIIQKYLEFLRVVCAFEERRIKAVIHYHDTVSYDQCLAYWSGVTKIPPKRFNKPFIKKAKKNGSRRFPYGIVRVVARNIILREIFKERLAALDLPCD